MLTIATPPRILIVFVLCLIVQYSRSQPADLQFEHLTMAEGLSQDIVNSLHIDRLGFLWIGTEDGLNRFDGYSVISYKHNPRDTNTLINNRITGICDFGSEDLLVATESGISIYNRAKDIFVKPTGSLNPYAGMGSAKPLSDRRGRYWLIIESRRILHYDPANDSVLLLDPFSKTLSSGDVIKDLMIDFDDSVWVTSENSISVYRGEAEGFQTFQIHYSKPGTVNLSSTKDHDGNFWIATNGGLYQLDRKNGTTTFVPLGFKMGGRINDGDQFVGGICCDRKGRIWLGGFNGLYCFNPKTNTTCRYGENKNNPMSLRSSRVYKVLLDSSDVLWVGTWRGGLSKADLKKERFGHYRHSETTPLAGASNDITAIFEQPRGTLWFASLKGGITGINFDRGTFQYLPNGPGNNLNFSTGEISSISGDTSGNLWIAADDKVARYDSRKRTFSTFTIPANRAHNFQIQIVYIDREGYLWMGIQSFGIVRYDPRANAFFYFTPADPAHITGAWMFFEDHHGTLWAGGWGGNGKLFKYDRQRDQFTPILRGELESARTVVEDKDGSFWIGTWGMGMSRYDPETGAVQQYLEQDGLPNNFVKGILMDEGRNLWISTEKGLSKFSLTTRTFKNYSVSDGLQGNLYYTGSCLKGSDGRLCFGGSNGFNAFYPDNIRDESYSPLVVLTDFRVFDQPRAFDHHLSLMKQISLPYHEDVFSFEYVSLDFSSPNRNRYAYKLEGYDHDWIDAGFRRYASYTHLDPGDYLFKVKGTNRDGVWSSHIGSIRLTIAPAFWQTWWFRISLVVALIGVLYILYRYRINKLLELERTRSTIATDLHDDIGTSLTNIALFSDLAQRDINAGSPEVIHRLEKISHTSRTLLDSMNDIVWSIKPENDALEQTILRMEDYAVEMLEENGIDLHVEIPEQLKRLKLSMVVRRNLFLIFKEAIGNVLKHANATHVDVMISTSERSKRQHNLQLVITDNGKGFDSSAHRRGNGLNNMELRAQLLNGSISVLSANGQGTKVEIRFPIKSPI